MDNPATVHDINELTVVTDESTRLRRGLQREISESLAARPRKATEKYFVGNTIITPDGESIIEAKLAKIIHNYLVKNAHVDDDDQLTETYEAARDSGTEAVPASDDLKPLLASVLKVVDAAYLDLPIASDARKPKSISLNDNLEKKEFIELWSASTARPSTRSSSTQESSWTSA